jgi:hypothetical protein
MHAGIRVANRRQTQLRRLKRTLQRFVLAQLLGYLSSRDRRLRGGFVRRLIGACPRACPRACIATPLRVQI